MQTLSDMKGNTLHNNIYEKHADWENIEGKKKYINGFQGLEEVGNGKCVSELGLDSSYIAL